MEYQRCEFAVATVYSGKSIFRTEVEGVKYYLLPNNFKKLEEYFYEVRDEFGPDIIHIHGTEYSYGMYWIKAFGADNVIISIQGLVSVIERYYFAGLECKQILTNYTFRDLIRGGIFSGRRHFRQAGIVEKDYICRVKHIIGRTEWDRVHALTINSNISYYTCNETLRDSFYEKNWNLEKCNKHTIQCPSCTYPIKGLHVLLEALRIVKQYFPNVLLKVPGPDVTWRGNIIHKLKQTGYGKYLMRLIRRHNLEENVKFIGILNDVEVAEELTKSHVFVCPSAIENSSNSLCEAQIVGVPCIASIAGGSPTIITHELTGLLYRYEEYEHLAFQIIRLFNDDDCTRRLSINGRREAQKRHCKETNAEQLITIYSKIINQ